MTKPLSLQVKDVSRRGRPSLSGTSEPSSVIGVRLPASQRDQVDRMASARRMDTSSYIRELLILTLPPRA